MRKSTLAALVAMLALALNTPGRANAQSQWLEPYTDPAIYVEILKPSFEAGDLTFLSSVWFLSGRVGVSEDVVLVAEVPLAFAEPDVSGETDAEGALGNIYVGFDWRPGAPEFFGELGIRLPLVDEPDLASLVGFSTDFVDRLEAFASDLFAVQAAANYLRRYPSGFAFRLRFSPIADFFTEADETEVFFLYSGQGWYEVEALAVGAGLSGRWLVTSGDGDLGGTTAHQLVLFGSYEVGRFSPGLQMRIPLDEEVSDLVEFVFGLTVGIRLD